jgi:hypothetical protein
MKPMTEQHLALFRRHMVEIIDMHFDLAEDEIGKSARPAASPGLMDVPRHLFVPESLMLMSYQDTPLPIGFDKTVSQPFIGALMIDLLGIEPGNRVLEVGTGLGYQSAVMARWAPRCSASRWSRNSPRPPGRASRRSATMSRSGSATARAAGGACAVRPDPGHRRRRRAADGAGRSAQAGGRMVIPLGRGGAAAERRREGRGRRDFHPLDHAGALHPARRGGLAASVRYGWKTDIPLMQSEVDSTSAKAAQSEPGHGSAKT